MIMTPDHPKWKAFKKLLEGPEGCNFTKDKDKQTTWVCYPDHSLTRSILQKHYPDVDIDGSIQYFKSHGGHCDCEILFNC